MKRVRIVCTNGEYGCYIAFDADKPEIVATGRSRAEAFAKLIEKHAAHFGLEIEEIQVQTAWR